MLRIKAGLLYNRNIKEDYFHLALNASRIAREARPGQFVQIKLTDTHAPLLRRPFSIHRVNGQHIEIIYQVVGKGTELLRQRRPGEYLDLLGPLGKGFDYRKEDVTNQKQILVAGGMGVAPLLFLAEKIKAKDALVLIGAKNQRQILCAKEFKRLGFRVRISTDDGSQGFQGKVTDLLQGILAADKGRENPEIYACGPRPMLKEISRISRKHKIEAQISLEEHMACGIGACLGCVVNTQDGYQRVCKEGPVFWAERIVWR